MVSVEYSYPDSVHRVTKTWRWFTVLAVPPLLALMSWAAYEAVNNYRSDEVHTSLWLTVLALALFGGLSLTFLAALVWAFRARIAIDGEVMEVRGAFLTTLVTPERMEGFRDFDGKLYVYLRDRRWGIEIGYFENPWLIRQWVVRHTTDVVAELLEEEEQNVEDEFGPGTGEADRQARLASLGRVVRSAEIAVYLSAVIAFVNFLAFEDVYVELVSVGVLVLTPFLLDLFALSNRGHVQADHDEGSRYPEIFTATLVGGVSLMLLALLDRGALLDNFFYEVLIVAALAKGLLWCFIDAHRFRGLPKRGNVVVVLTIAGYFLMPAAWVGGSLYHCNKLLDRSVPHWYETEVVEAKVSKGKTTSYSVTVAPWDETIPGPVEITVRRAEFETFEQGMAVRVAVRDGAIRVRWVSGLEPVQGQ